MAGEAHSFAGDFFANAFHLEHNRAGNSDTLDITNITSAINGNPMIKEAINPKIIIPTATGLLHLLLVAIRSNLLLLNMSFFWHTFIEDRKSVV